MVGIISPANGSTKDYALARIQEIAAKKHLMYSRILLGLGDDTKTERIISLCDRNTRKFDGSPYNRNPAIADFITLLEKTFQQQFNITKFDGYIVPSDGSEVTRLMYCREFQRNPEYDRLLRYGGDRTIEAYQLAKDLLGDLDPLTTVIFSRITLAPVDFLFTPKDYPYNDDEAKLRRITLIKDVFGDLSIECMNISDIRNYLKSLRKRPTSKSMSFACTKLEFYLANNKPEGHEKTIAFPGDIDGVLLKQDGSPVAILEYKADTKNMPIEGESADKYAASDKTRFTVLDDICRILNLPLVIIFWSIHHTKAKIVFRDAINNSELADIVKALTYKKLAEEMVDLITRRLGM